MFKIGEKVVFVGGDVVEYGCILPKINEIVTISGHSIDYKFHYRLEEYPMTFDGVPQSFSKKELRKLKDVLDEQSEKMLEDILKTINEPQLI
jgi:hypothetical protein